MLKTRLETFEILKSLIGYPSVSATSNEAISQYVAGQLQSLGFDIETTFYVDNKGVKKVNVVAHRPAGVVGSANEQAASIGGVAYFCHTDVVPARRWTGPGGDPFTAVVADAKVYGRGSCDMKGSLAAFIAAVKLVPQSQQRKSIWVIATADEEIGFGGAKHLIGDSKKYREIVKAQPLCIIGEPTLLRVVHAHKGIVVFRVRSVGRAAHSSRSDGINANVAMIPMLNKIAELHQRTLEESRYHDDRFEPATLSWNFGFSDHDTPFNVTAAVSEVWVSLRTMPEIDGEDLIEEAKRFAESLKLEFIRHDGGPPLWVPSENECVTAMCELAQGEAVRECYSTDGGQFTELSQRLVIGPGDIAQAHTADEWISFDQLDRGTELYRQTIDRWCC